MEHRCIPLRLERVVEFLLARGLISHQVLVEGDLRVEEIPGRNHNFRLVASGGPSYFLKQAPPEDLDDPRLPVEAEIYRRVLQDRSWFHLQPFVPRFRCYDAEHAVLVTDLEIGLEDVGWFGEDHSVLGLARMSKPLAYALAACHRVDPCADPSDLEFLPRMAPGILGISRPHPAALQYLSPAQIQILQVVQDHPGLAATFDEICEGWSEVCLIHGDVKWTNVLVRVDPESGGPGGIVFTDWELAQVGDPAWDVGSVFHSYLAHAVVSAAVPHDATPRAAAEAMGAALPSFYGELGDFWNSYACATASSSHDGEGLLSRSILCCVARLVQSAYEWSQDQTTIPGHAAAILQLGVNLLIRPDDARQVVFGSFVEQHS